MMPHVTTAPVCGYPPTLFDHHSLGTNHDHATTVEPIFYVAVTLPPTGATATTRL